MKKSSGKSTAAPKKSFGSATAYAPKNKTEIKIIGNKKSGKK